MKIRTYVLIGLILIVILIGGCIQQTKSTYKTDINNTNEVVLDSKKAIIETSISEGELDRQTIAQLSLEWAIIGKNIPDYDLIKDKNNIIVSIRNINKNYNFSLENITFSILTQEEIQQKSNTEGDFLYFEFQMLNVSDNNATVKLNNIWAESEENKKKGLAYLSGGGATIPFKKERDGWLSENVTEMWIS